jgi:hypothetical protein
MAEVPNSSAVPAEAAAALTGGGRPGPASQQQPAAGAASAVAPRARAVSFSADVMASSADVSGVSAPRPPRKDSAGGASEAGSGRPRLASVGGTRHERIPDARAVVVTGFSEGSAPTLYGSVLTLLEGTCGHILSHGLAADGSAISITFSDVAVRRRAGR